MNAWLNSLVSNTPPLYKFELINTETSESLVLSTPPIEWADGVTEFNRRLEVGGVFTSFTIDSLTFIKEGAKFLRDIEADKKINGKAELIISWFKYSTRTYQEFPSRLSLNFSRAYPNVKVGKTSIGFNIPAVNSSTLTKFDNRKKIKIDITKLFSIGGFNIVDYPDLLKDFRFGEINAYKIASWEYNGTNDDVVSTDDDLVTTVANQLLLSDFTEAQEVQLVDVGSNPWQHSIFRNSEDDNIIDIEISGTLNWILTRSEAPDRWKFNGQIVIYKFDSGYNIIDTIIIKSISKSESTGNDTYDASTSFSYDGQITIDTGESFGFYFQTDTADTDSVTQTINFNEILTGFSQGIITSDPVTVEAFPVYETGERLCQHILDTQFPFYSEFLGRLDTPYNIAGDLYSTENQLRFASIMSGLNLRGEKLDNINNPLALSWDDYFKSIQSIWNIGYSLEMIDDFLRIRVENYDFFFNDSIVLDISDRISKYDIESEVMPELAYLSIKSGYKKFDYEEINGRGEYNSTNERTSIIETDTTLDNVVALRGDTKGITKSLNKAVTSDGTKDEKEDNHVFIVKSQRSAEPNEDWKAETDENITIEDNTSLFQEGSLNLYCTPTRNLKRNANRITGAFVKYLSSKLRFQTSDKLQTLKTTGEGYTVTENDDLVINDLDAPIFTPKKYKVEVRFDFSDLATIQANTKGLIKFTDEIQGYLLNLRKKNNEDKAIIEIIEKYVD